MSTTSHLSVALAMAFSLFTLALQASELATDVASDGTSASNTSSEDAFTEEMRWYIKRQVMSKPGVMLDMATMTDNGYVWSNDVVWAGSGLPDNESWYIAGFYFERPGYKGVWLQYAFTFLNHTGAIQNFRRWYGAGKFR